MGGNFKSRSPRLFRHTQDGVSQRLTEVEPGSTEDLPDAPGADALAAVLSSGVGRVGVFSWRNQHSP